jgi:hypothetical protein
MKLLNLRGDKMVGANGFEPSTSWSRTRVTKILNALSGVACGFQSLISPLLVVRNLYLNAIRLGNCLKRGLRSDPFGAFPVVLSFGERQGGKKSKAEIWRGPILVR